ncbi:sce7726 family protein [Bifidobacterium bombi]|nr:sce7726 family protein [Bifidobacterium bombi]
MMRDIDVRQAMRSTLKRRKENESALIMDELDLCGEVRVDIAVLNGHISGYELKSASDNLKRLPKQVRYYSAVLDYCNLVVAENHLDEALGMIHDFWGVYIARQTGDGRTFIRKLRNPKSNKSNIDPRVLVQLLWRDETIDILTRYGFDRGVRSKPKAVCWDRMVDSFSLPQLRKLVRTQLEARTNWRTDGTSL